MNSEEALEIFPEMTISEEIKQSMEGGWWGSKPKETLEECIERAKQLIKDFRTLSETNKNATIFLTSHGDFIHVFICLLSGQNLPQNML